MPAGGFLEQKRRSPGSLAVVVALHGAAITALLLAKSEFITQKDPPIVVRPIPETPEPPPSPPERRREAKELPQSVVDYVLPEVPVPTLDPVVLGQQTDVDPVFDPGPVGTGEVKQLEPAPVPPPPLRDLVRTDAQLDARSQLQPAYPAAEQRADREGSVTVRLLIGADGRVKAVEKVRATSDAFFRATEQQALRHWRFKPATVDGEPVESRKTMTVHFRLAA